MSILSETQHAEAPLVSEASHTRSRETVTILAGSGADRVLTAGMVLGARLSGTAVSAAFAGNTGDGAMGAVTVSGSAKDGDYKLVIIETVAAAGAFELTDPDGELVDVGDVAAVFSAGGLAFTLADGAADFVAGDGFTITVTQTARKHLQFDESASTGEQIVSGVLLADVTALDAVDNKQVILARDAEVNGAELVWPPAISDADKTDGIQALTELGIIVR